MYFSNLTKLSSKKENFYRAFSLFHIEGTDINLLNVCDREKWLNVFCCPPQNRTDVPHLLFFGGCLSLRHRVLVCCQIFRLNQWIMNINTLPLLKFWLIFIFFTAMQLPCHFHFIFTKLLKCMRCLNIIFLWYKEVSTAS